MTTIKLSKELFDRAVVDRCIEDYAEIADCELKETNDAYIVSVFNCRYDEYETAREFENYVIEIAFRRQKRCT